ncbi:MAG: class II fructose-bisphosphate aldolase [Rickettsiales bacterium]|jgi:fructose-bisphosphate aldolase class II|nr:class II fructose-bisphosphate aldolase [Rickettsiales bacterium]
MKNPLRLGRAIPAFNFYNLESLKAILTAADGRPVICAASESAIKYMGDDFLRDFAAPRCWLHLDHGRSIDAVKHAIKLGFSSVMIDGSALPFSENVKLTRAAVALAHKHNIPVEAELGTLSGFEEGVSGIREQGSRTEKNGIIPERNSPSLAKGWPPRSGGRGSGNNFTNPAQALQFVNATACDSLAIAIGTSHGAYKGDGHLRFDILTAIRKLLPKTPLVLHGASTIPQKYARILGLKGAEGIAPAEIRRAVKLGINKVNIDSDARLAWTAGLQSFISKDQKAGQPIFDPRAILAAATAEVIKLYKEDIKIICG